MTTLSIAVGIDGAMRGANPSGLLGRDLFTEDDLNNPLYQPLFKEVVEYLTKSGEQSDLDKICKIIAENFNNQDWSCGESITSSKFLHVDDKQHASKDRKYFLLSIICGAILTGLSSEIDTTINLDEILRKLNGAGKQFHFNKPCAQSASQPQQDVLEPDENTSEHNPLSSTPPES